MHSNVSTEYWENNNRSIEAQMMKRFLSDTEVMRIPTPTEFRAEFEDLVKFQKKSVGTVDTDNCGCDLGIEIPRSSKRSVFNSSEVYELNRVFTALYPGCSIDVCSSYSRYSTVIMGGKVYGSINSLSVVAV